MNERTKPLRNIALFAGLSEKSLLELAEITESEYFQSLQQRAKELRGKTKDTNH